MINIFVPQDTTALALGSDEIASLLTESISSRGLDVKLIRNGSRGMFWLEPLLEIEFEGDRFGFGPITMSDVPSIIDVLEDSHSDLKNIAHPLFLGSVENIEYRIVNKLRIKQKCHKIEPNSLTKGTKKLIKGNSTNWFSHEAF